MPIPVHIHQHGNLWMSENYRRWLPPPRQHSRIEAPPWIPIARTDLPVERIQRTPPAMDTTNHPTSDWLAFSAISERDMNFPQ